MKKLLLLLISAVALLSCKTAPTQLGQKTGLPGKSIATIAPALYSDALASLTMWMKNSQQCELVEVLDTQGISEEGEVLMDQAGRLYSGVVKEKWIVSGCEKVYNLAMVFQPDGKGGNFIGIANISPE